MSCVAAPCSSTAPDIAEEISEIRPMVSPISLIADTDNCVADCICAICVPISSVALAVWLASALTSEATTAKPLPASPARAASIVAFNARRLVCSATAEIILTTSPMRTADCDSSLIRPFVCSACVTASLETFWDSSTCRPISVTEATISSVAAAADDGALLHLRLLRRELPVFQKLVAEHRQCAGNLTDLVATVDGIDIAIEVALREILHRARHLDQRRGKPSAEQECQDRHRQDGDADRPKHVPPYRCEFSLDLSLPLIGRSLHGDQRRS